ncbi:MAG: hypothetical protein HY835_07360 [Anaerolineae bacterium]|nr:hypothetical protein [Anaerolineae bacterium]
MHSLLDILRGPAVGVVIMIIALAGVIVVTAFAALIAQVGLLMRLRPWQPQPAVKAQAVNQHASQSTRRSPRYSVREPDESEAIDPDW